VRIRLGTPFGDAHQLERSFDMREVKRAARFFPTISEGIAQRVRADASHASSRRRESFCPHHFCPCGVVQSSACLSCRRSPEQSRSGTQISIALKALSAMHSLGKRISPVQFRVRAPQSSQRSSGFHKPASPRAALGIATISPPCSSLRISFVKKSRRSSTGWRLHSILLA
jgi:hypothetical protein